MYRVLKVFLIVTFSFGLNGCTSDQQVRNGMATLIDVGAAVGMGVMASQGNSAGVAGAYGAGGLGQRLMGNRNRANAYFKGGQSYSNAMANNYQRQSAMYGKTGSEQSNATGAGSGEGCLPPDITCSPCSRPHCPE